MRKFLRDESGQGMLEYTLVVALVMLIAVGMLQVLGEKSAKAIDVPLPQYGSTLS